MKTNLFARVFLLGCLAMCGLEALASGGVVGLPNQILGGHSYFYPDVRGNTTDNPSNVLGHIQKQVDGYRPVWGRTNVIYMARSDAFSVPFAEYAFNGNNGYNKGREVSGNSGELSTGKSTERIYWSKTADSVVFKVANALDVSDTFTSEARISCYFTSKTNPSDQCMVQIFLINRNNAYYRVPRSDIYYVPTGTSLWFCKFKSYLGSPWIAPGEGDGYTFEAKTSADNFDKFTITASADSEVHLRTEATVEQGGVDVTVHVVDENFTLTPYLVYFMGKETRKLSTILHDCETDWTTNDVADVWSPDESQIAVAENGGDWDVRVNDFFDVDREVTVRLKNGSVLLLKVTSMTGRCDESLCARVKPDIRTVPAVRFTNLVRDDAGKLVTPPVWEETDKIDNAPPGYTNVCRVLNAVLYEGKRYSVYIASKSLPFVKNDSTEAKGQFRCIWGQRKVIMWLEDSEGKLFKSPALSIGNSSHNQVHETRFNLGTPNCLYTTDQNLANRDLPDGLTPYVGTKLQQGKDDFQGAVADIYGYCAILACAEDSSEEGNSDELSVYLIEGVKTVEVKKTVIGSVTADRFEFEAVYHDGTLGDDCDWKIVTNRFSLADGESTSFLVKTGGMFRVTETVPEGCLSTVRADRSGPYAETNVYEIDQIHANRLVEFRNVGSGVRTPPKLWITDHCDAGSNRVNLAFAPIFEQGSVDLAQWLDQARTQDVVRVARAARVDDLATAEPEPVEYPEGLVDRDVDKGWVWITADSSSVTNDDVSLMCWKILVNPLADPHFSYTDEVVSVSCPLEAVKHIKGGTDTDVYVFTNGDDQTEIKLNRKSRLKSALLVGGGGAGGGAVGGGGGGGEVRQVEIDDSLDPGALIYIDVGRGGMPSLEKSAKFGTSTIWTSPGNNGGDTVLSIGDREPYVAVGGGGGGSYDSTFFGVMNPKGLGRPGANGGGSAGLAQTGGVATVSGGYPGGGAIGTARHETYGPYAAGGGGGMGMAAATATNQAYSSAGGEGVTNAITGEPLVYGAGGGGGGRYYSPVRPSIVFPGLGGSHAGKGGEYTAGQSGEDGFGAGGGGGGVTNNVGYPGGRGGNGTVILEFQNASVIDASAKASVVTPFTVGFEAKPIAVASGSETVDVEFAFAKDGDPLEYAQIKSAQPVGELLTHFVDDLEPDTEYAYSFRFKNGDETLVVDGGFKTVSLGFVPAYRSDLFWADGTDFSIVTNDESGDYTVVFSNTGKTIRAALRHDAVLTRALVVGGGGAGGFSNGGGGGGGGVKYLDETISLAMADGFSTMVGAGGEPEAEHPTEVSKGSDSVLTVVDRTWTAAGGGYGASSTDTTGGAGANGGGAGGGDVTSSSRLPSGGPGESGGFAGGKAGLGAQVGSAYKVCDGGGAGAAETGETGASIPGCSGRGGEGVADDIVGTVEVYGSGGGGGSNLYCTNAVGGTHGGAGGNSNEELDSPLRNGGDGVDGTGSGGGGGCYAYTNATKAAGYPGGRGGNGTVILRIRTIESKLEGTARVSVRTPFAGEVFGTVTSLPAGQDGATVSVAWKEHVDGEAFVDNDYVEVASGVGVGGSVTNRIGELKLDTRYDFSYRFVSGGQTVYANGQFKTERSIPSGYIDVNDYFLADNTTGLTVSQLENGLVSMDVTGTSANLKVIPKKNVTFVRALVVGGGGAGGSSNAGGAGGGGVIRAYDLSGFVSGQEVAISATVGKGGTSGGSTTPQLRTGANSVLTVGALNWTAVGGGAGANSSEDGDAGGSGGGGGGGNNADRVGGAGTADQGFAGGGNGKGAMSGKDQCYCPGGGGGASEVGQKGAVVELTSGRGGEGVSDDITGSVVIYGSGGGGGKNTLCTNAVGGTNAGRGRASGVSDYNGQNGTGAGGGGGYYADKGYYGGAGGTGKVILLLGTSDCKVAGFAEVSSLSSASATLVGTLLAASGTGATVSFAWTTNGVDITDADYRVVAEGKKVGESVSVPLTEGLEPDVKYDFAFKFECDGVTSIVRGQFKTWRRDADPAAAIVMNEFMASNGDTLLTANGMEGLDWVKIRNLSGQDVDLSGWTLSKKADGSDGKEIKGNAVVPANGRLIVWADKDYKDFTADEASVKMNIGKEPGTLTLVDSSGAIRTSIDYPDQLKDVSYGIDSSGQLGYFDPATPGVATTGNALTMPTPAVEILEPHGYKTEPVSVAMRCPDDETAEIHYTTNGAKPTLSSPLYRDPITVNRTTCIRAAVVDERSVLQNDASATYIFLDDVLEQSTATPAGFPASGAVNGHPMVYGMNPDVVNGPDRERLLKGFTNSIPTMSFVVDPKDLFDPDTGIYVNSENENSGKAWERKALVEQFDPTDPGNGFSWAAGLRLRGGNSRDKKSPKHAFRLFFRDEYGSGKLKFPLFGGEGAEEFKKVDLRCSQNYSWAKEDSFDETFVHEVFSRDTQRDTDDMYTRSRYCHLFLNGQYWGLYQTQERGDENFAETYNGGDADDYDVIKTDDQGDTKVTEANAGTLEAWSELWRIAVSEGVEGTHADNYRRLLGCNPDGTRNPDYPVLLNPTNLASFMINVHYMVDADSPVAAGNPNNLYALRDRRDGDSDSDGFFFLRHDAEHSMGTTKCLDGSTRRTSCKVTDDPTARGTELQSSSWKTFANFSPAELNYALLNHPDYKMLFADVFYRTCLKPGGALTDEKATERFRSRMAEIDDAIVCEAARWARKGQTRQTWLDACGECLWFITNRMPKMVTHYRNRGWYPSIDAPTIAIADGKATFTAANPVYYTLDGSDPRTNGILAEGDVTLPATGTTLVRARCKSAAGEWSALDEAIIGDRGLSPGKLGSVPLKFAWLFEARTPRVRYDDTKR